MLDIRFITENKELIEKNSKDRGASVDVDRLIELAHKGAEILKNIEEKRGLRNKTSKTKPTEEEITAMRQLGEEIASLEKEREEVSVEIRKEWFKIPNLTHPDAPIGGEEDFKVLTESGKIPQFDFQAKDHEALAVSLGLLDFERGAKVAGSKFYFAKGNLVRLNQALVQYGIDVVTKHGYELMETPDMAKDSILSGIGFSPRGPETQIYSIENSDLSLIGTAEITMGGYHQNEIIDLSEGPKKYVALSHCYRTEAGTYGRESKGLYRVHQFTKLEMFIYCRPEDSEKMHAELLSIEREIMDGLELPYRVIDIASGDLGGPAYRKFDIEAWMVMKNGYGEVTSTSNCTDYQARRLAVRYKKSEGENILVHTLNGTAITTSRLPIAILENYQTKEGKIMVPKVLQPYMNGMKEIG